jgi:hypothetical protein
VRSRDPIAGRDALISLGRARVRATHRPPRPPRSTARPPLSL